MELSSATLVTATISDGGRVVAGPLAVSVRGTTLPGWSGTFALPPDGEVEEGGEYQFDTNDGGHSLIVVTSVRVTRRGEAEVRFTAAGRFGHRPARPGAATPGETLVPDPRGWRTTTQEVEEKLAAQLHGAGRYFRESHRLEAGQGWPAG
jgi:hypothetical protein